ncbi:MAG: hypothetical protein IKH13_07970 [Clostridia bacterium]|nr:hypothetical protein [Clostridia bacterium]
MRHNLKISVSKEPDPGAVVTCSKVTIREKILKLLFGKPQKVMVLVPGGSVEEVAISEIKDGGDSGA